MKNKFWLRLFAAILVALMLATAFSACGGTPKETEKQTSGETKPAETKPSETEKEETKQTDPAETEPSGTEPGETEQGETEPEETKPAGTEQGETEPGETKPAETEKQTEDDPMQGYQIRFVTDGHAKVLVYRTQADLAAGNGTEAATAASRDGETGMATKDGGQINFVVVCDDGYVASIAEDGVTGTYKNMRTPRDIGIEGAYRFTKIESDMEVYIQTVNIGAESADSGYRVTFSAGAGVTVTAFANQQSLTPCGTEWALSRDGETGAATKTDGQVNFRIDLADGYVLDTLTVDGDYNNLKTPGDIGEGGTYRITKIASAITVTVTAKPASQDADTNGYAVTFVHDGHVKIYVYRMQDYSGEPTLSDRAVSRDGLTGAATKDDGQVNFLVVCDEGYVAKVEVTGSFKNLKTPEDLGEDDLYRVTKISGAVTVSVTSVPEA